MLKYYILFTLYPFYLLRADFHELTSTQSNILLQYNGARVVAPYPNECREALEEFAKHASNFTLCSILNARPVTLCEKCVNNYVSFRDKYKQLLDTVVNNTSCRSVFMASDRLNVVQTYHDNILEVWNKGKCNGCFDWADGTPTLKNTTVNFYKMFNDTNVCINKYNSTDNNEVCNRCMQYYVKLDEFYKTLSSDAIGVDSVCMDIVDSMNTTRSIWSKEHKCCNLRRTPEVIFLCCTGIISFLPILYYCVVRFFGPIRNLPNVLKQSRIKQTILRSLSRDSRSD